MFSSNSKAMNSQTKHCGRTHYPALRQHQPTQARRTLTSLTATWPAQRFEQPQQSSSTTTRRVVSCPLEGKHGLLITACCAGAEGEPAAARMNCVRLSVISPVCDSSSWTLEPGGPTIRLRTLSVSRLDRLRPSTSSWGGGRGVRLLGGGGRGEGHQNLVELNAGEARGRVWYHPLHQMVVPDRCFRCGAAQGERRQCEGSSGQSRCIKQRCYCTLRTVHYCTIVHYCTLLYTTPRAHVQLPFTLTTLFCRESAEMISE